MFDLKKLPKEHQMWTVELSNKNSYVISATTKDRIVSSKSQFLELSDGTVINRAFIVDIHFSKDATKEHMRTLPMDQRKPLLDAVIIEKKARLADALEIPYDYELPTMRL